MKVCSKNISSMIFCIALAIVIFSCKNSKTDPVKTIKTRGETLWLSAHEFNPDSFNTPPLAFGPFTRWWWPGNDVTKEELKREINVFVENGFGGVEIQPFTRGLNPDASPEELDRVLSWDTPEFYDNLRTVLDEAQSKGLTVDLNGGSGWPSGGPHVSQEDNILNLGFSDVNVRGGNTVHINVPMPSMKHRPVAMGGIPVKYAEIDKKLAKLQAVVAAKIIREDRDEPVQLDPDSKVDISDRVKDNIIDWDAPDGNWKIIAFWSYPAGEIPVLIAKKDPGLVVDHFDSVKVAANYEYLLGDRTGLIPYYGKPLRAIFNDSYEFKVDRHYSPDFLKIFKHNRGYDITPYLPVNMQPGYNNHSESAYYPNQKPSYYYSEEDWRLQYDYDNTLSDVLQMHFFNSSRKWLETRGMLHRTQAYGLHMDIIAASGNASIPETEQLFSEGSEGFLKLITSGAHLYNRPIISAESFVYRYRGEMTTPQKIRISIDKAVAAGVNQIIYHGTSYKYMTSDFSKAGWNAWDSPFTPNITYSSNITETDNFWKDIKEINKYISRVQYAVRSGRPKTDVLIYFPFLGVESRELMSNPEEVLPLGYFKGIEPEDVIPAFGAPPREPAESTKWYHKIWGIVNMLEAAGIPWEFTNDISIQEARMNQDVINIRGNEYKALILPYVPYIQKESAVCLKELCKKGARLLVVGPVPDKQPGYLNFRENDQKTKQLVEEAVSQKNSGQIFNEAELYAWMSQIKQKIKFKGNYDFVRQVQCEMADGSSLHFIWNKSDKWQELALSDSVGYQNKYWLDAEKGTITKIEGEEISYLLPPYNTILFYASAKNISDKLLSKPATTGHFGKVITTIDVWDVKIGDAFVKNSGLFDWRSKDEFKYKADDGVYKASFKLTDKIENARYFIDLGTLYFTADVTINERPAGKRIYAPYELDITAHLIKGENQVKIIVTPTQRNYSIGEALKGNPKFAQFKNLEKTLMPAGLLGPVKIKLIDNP